MLHVSLYNGVAISCQSDMDTTPIVGIFILLHISNGFSAVDYTA